MTRVRARVAIDPSVPVVDAEQLWYDLARWSAFVEGFGHVAKVDAAWPHDGVLIWDSVRDGRGRVVESVARFVVREGQDADVEDPKITGVQRVRFAPGTVSLELDYRLKDSAWLMDLLFVRRAQRDALVRTLRRFAVELRTDRELALPG